MVPGKLEKITRARDTHRHPVMNIILAVTRILSVKIAKEYLYNP
jgi:hypothetical protein